jgi:hypothetical protein
VSGFTQTTTELLHSFYGAATVSVPSASAVTITAGIPEVVVPASYMSALGKRSSSLCLKFGGYMTATATVPTFAFGLAYTAFATPPAFSAATPLATLSNTITPTAATGSFEAEMNIGLRSMGLGNASTIWASGHVWASPALTTSVWWLNPLGAGGTTVTTWQTDQEYYLWPYLTLGAATASNTVTLQYIKLYGEN